MPPSNECPDVMGLHDPIHREPLHRRFRTRDDLHPQESQLDRIERKLDTLLEASRPRFAATTWEMP